MNDKNKHGRGASSNPSNRYEKLSVDWDRSEDTRHNGGVGSGDEEGEQPLLRTEFLRDSSRSIVTENNSPDVGFRFSLNAYRGCEHGCAYCYARPTHEYLGLSAGLDFESKIFVKEEAPTLLREKLMSKSWQPECISMSGVTDCYQPIERKLQLTRKCLEVLLEFRNPVGIITKNRLVTRDLDLFIELAKYQAIVVFLSVTTLDEELGRSLEPRTSTPTARLEAIKLLADNGIPVGVNVGPVIPGLTDHELPEILTAAAKAGARFAGYTPVRLPLTVLPIFTEWLEVHRPLKKAKVLEAIRDIRGGKLNDARFGSRMRGEGPVAENLKQMFKIYARRAGLNKESPELSVAHFRRPEIEKPKPDSGQMSFF